MTNAADLRDALRQAEDDGLHVPCLGRDEWVSDAPSDRPVAVEGCSRCPVSRVCLAFAKDNHMNAGIWGGRNFAAKPGRGAFELPSHVVRRIQELFQEGHGRRVIARALGLQEHHVRPHLPPIPGLDNRLAPHRDAVLALRREGLLHKEIAERLGITTRQSQYVTEREPGKETQ